ncbi:MAG: FAD-dependent monooxygenase [Polaromonas sp.]|nr:FAD-dependent monooxygenase [Polaromonas sp.]
MKKLKIVIIGAGVAGAILARRLARLPQVELHCLEKVEPEDHSEAGTGLNVGPNAIKALQQCDAELAAQVCAQSLPWASWRTSLSDGTVLFDLPLESVADNAGIRIRWSELYDVLRAGAQGVIQYGCEITSIAPSASDPLRSSVSWTQRGVQHRLDEIDLLVGVDGRYSATRSAFSGLPPPRHVGVAIVRTLVEDTSGGLIDDYEQWFNGPHRLLAFRVPPGHVYIAATFPIAQGEQIHEEWKTEAVMRATYAPAGGQPCAQVRWLLDAMCANLADSHWARMQESEVLFAEARRQVMYLGDSAHGMAPTLGQGATQAIEDACCAALIIEREAAAGRLAPRGWLDLVAVARTERIRFAMELSVQATDTLLQGADPVSGAHWKTEPPFLDQLSRLFRQVALGQRMPAETGTQA